MAVDERLNDRMAMAYGPPGPPPPTVYAGYENRRGSLLDLRRAPRPPASVPHAAQRNTPKIVSRAPQSGTAPTQQQAVATVRRLVGGQACSGSDRCGEETGGYGGRGDGLRAAVCLQPR